MIEAQISLDGSSDLLKAYAAALEPEQNFKTSRGSYSLNKLSKKLEIKIKAGDVTIFRAIINTITGLLAIVHKTWSAEKK